ncbi:MAG: pyridoxal phosphate-dependent aminotransferase [Gemmatimonadetes bacterium]|nr:pyridoxal phosphate-dependent aminotransferase [Gemmatimonadota bacterium]
MTDQPVRFSSNIDALEPSATLAFAARARELRAAGHSIIDLSAGEPAFPTPAFAAKAGIHAIEEGWTKYPPTPGVPELRSAVAAYLQQTCGHASGDPSRVLVSAGVKQALFNCLFCLFEAGDEVLVPSPGWPTYVTAVRLTGAAPVVFPTTWEDGFQITVAALEELRGSRTRGLIINSPSNPTGAVYPFALIEELTEWCGRHGIWLLSDEIYRRLYYEGPSAPSVYDVAERPEHVVLLDGVSKAFAMTGWRIGFAEGPAELIGAAADLQSQTTSGAASPSQYAAAAAFGRREEREAAIGEFVRLLERNRVLGVEKLDRLPGLEVRKPEGGIYLFAKIAGKRSSAQMAEELLEAGVACVPGEPFGSPGYLRFNFAVAQSVLEEGLDRVARYLEG